MPAFAYECLKSYKKALDSGKFPVTEYMEQQMLMTISVIGLMIAVLQMRKIKKNQYIYMAIIKSIVKILLFLVLVIVSLRKS